MSRWEQPITIAILGIDSVPEYVLALLLEQEGYAARLLKVPYGTNTSMLPEASSVDDLLEDVDMVLIWPAPSLREDARKAFLDAMIRTPATAAIPALALPRTLEVALQDKLAVDVPLEEQFECLVRDIEATLLHRSRLAARKV